MAKVKNPLFSMRAGGAVGASIIYGRSNGTSIAKRWHQPSGNASAQQSSQRQIYSAAALVWRGFTAPQKHFWSQKAKLGGLSGWHVFLSSQLRGEPLVMGILWDSGATIWDDGATVWE